MSKSSEIYEKAKTDIRSLNLPLLPQAEFIPGCRKRGELKKNERQRDHVKSSINIKLE